ncbi:PREDICTED: HAUS augmin-like complex subunit 7 isoform X1 [Poecilia mexicana]|uniref:HAUS augmin-like complex subunit 7 isoform X1 n=1 Tax=Poecilia mexicana TaxID=48701 RepID=UPI00072DE720|nr:PREDICTED: HAUS augmin-like complex subunit 7 isoform X1 [Poecilia mexicana]
MAGGLTEKQFACRVYDSLQVLSCPLVQDLYLQEEESMLELLCCPSALRTDILTWICRRINPKFGTSEAMSAESKDPDGLEKTEIAAMGQELMLCKADDLDLIKGKASPQRQLGFLEQLLSLVSGSSGHRTDAEALLCEVFAAENLPHLRQMLQPALDPWPAHVEALYEVPESAPKPGEEFPDVSDLLQSTQTQLEQLQSKCDFLSCAEENPAALSPSSLRLAAGDLQQQMMTFSHLYETDLRVYCSREPPNFSAETDLFQRVQQQLLACNTELEMQKEICEASGCVSEEVKGLQTQPRYWSRGEKHTLPDQLEEISQWVENIASQRHT